MNEEVFEDRGFDTEIDALLGRTVPGEETTSPDGDLIVRVRSIAFRRRWANSRLLAAYLTAAGFLITLVAVFYARPQQLAVPQG